MRRTLRQLAAVKPARYLEPGAPTGLTGLFTHPAPRSALLHIYNTTLTTLQKFPESSLYRESTEAVTKHRMAIVEALVPPGLPEWQTRREARLKEQKNDSEKVKEVLLKHISEDFPDKMKEAALKEIHDYDFSKLNQEVDSSPPDTDDRVLEWDGEDVKPQYSEGGRAYAGGRWERDIQKAPPVPEADIDPKTLDPEPTLTADQVAEIENKIGGGLIEEVIEVAEGELQLASIMLQAKVWEDLEEKPKEGQWTYFGRSHN